MCIQYLQQECRDSAKNGLPPRPIPSFWNNGMCEELNIYEDESEGILKDMTEEEYEFAMFNKRILTDKKPYYFRYIYAESDKQYTNFVNAMESSALRGFKKTIEEIKNTENKSEAEKEFMQRFEEKMPLSNNPCIINKIAKKVEDEFDKVFGYNRRNNNFDYSIYLYDNVDEKVTSAQIKKICDMYEEYKNINKSNKIRKRSIDFEGSMKDNEIVYEEMSRELIEIIPNEKLLVNTLIELSYSKSKVSKVFAWTLGGKSILRCMLSKNGNEITFPIRDENGNVEFNGEKFKMVKKVLEEEEI